MPDTPATDAEIAAAQPQRTFPVSWEELHRHTKALAWRLVERGPWKGIVAISRGGLVPAAVVARELEVRLIDTVCIASYDDRDQGQLEVLKTVPGDGEGWLIIDDLVDTGKTAEVVRNLLLSPEQRAVAPALYRVLCAAADQLAGGGSAGAPVMAAARTAILAAGFEGLDYLELRAEADLAALEYAERPARLFAAAWLGGVRLIDNVPVEPGPA